MCRHFQECALGVMDGFVSLALLLSLLDLAGRIHLANVRLLYFGW